MDGSKLEAFVGLDPSQSSCGYCFMMGNEVRYGTSPITGIESIEDWKWLDSAAVIYVTIEKVQFVAGRRYQAAAASAGPMLHFMKRRFPRKVKIVGTGGSDSGFVDPATWRHALMGLPRKTQTPAAKKAATHYALNVVLKDNALQIGNDEADAICICQYCKSFMPFREAQRKGKKKHG